MDDIELCQLNVKTIGSSYPIYISTYYKHISKLLPQIEGSKAVIITDNNVAGNHLNQLADEVENSGLIVYKYIFDSGEKSKNLHTVESIYDFLLRLHLDRSSSIIALGGGVVGDTAGFVASTFLRGINLIQVPTSLLAQIDSSVGGKVGVNFQGIKNVIGAFYQPRGVFINVNTLKTLPNKELKSGLAEAVCHAVIKDAHLLDFIENNISRIYDYDNKILLELIKINCSIKADIVEKDEKENNLRAILNFGHTIGHAIESVYEFRLLHGECISIGMIGAFKISNYLGIIDYESTDRMTKVLTKIGLPICLRGMNIGEVLNRMLYDKKIRNNELSFILPKAIGEVIQYNIEDLGIIKKVLSDLAL